jgi:hypothetical protein
MTSAAILSPTTGLLPGWKPGAIHAEPSLRRPGMMPAAADAWKGVTESGRGQSLSAVQVATLAPFMAREYHLPTRQVAKDLSAVRAYVGGPAANIPNTAVTLGQNIYLNNANDVDAIFSWDHRRWLAHELGHTMQWRGESEKLVDRLGSRDRAFEVDYGSRFVPGAHGKAGALATGTARWVKSRLPGSGDDHSSWSNDVHDTHPLEVEATHHALRFEQVTTPPAN